MWTMIVTLLTGQVLIQPGYESKEWCDAAKPADVKQAICLQVPKTHSTSLTFGGTSSGSVTYMVR